MKKLLCLLLALCMIVAFAACGGGGDNASNNAQETTNNSDGGNGGAAEVTGEVFDAGEVKALVPAGWKAFPVEDFWSDEEGVMDPTVIRIIKGGESDMDLFTHPYIQINYYGPDTTLWEPDMEFYDNGVELEPLTTGSHTWQGFTAESIGTPIAMLWTEEGDIQYQVSVTLEGSAGKITLEDADVLAILESIEPTA